MQVDATCQGNQKPKELKKDQGSYIKHMQGDVLWVWVH
jgi:hypothetical protein